MAVAAPYLLAASTAISAAGAIQQGNQAAASADYRAGVLRNEAIINEQRATTAEENARRAYADAADESFAAGVRGFDQDVAARSEIGAAARRYAASGLVDGGRALSTLETLAGQDRRRIALEGERRARQLRQEGRNFEIQANDFRTGAGAAMDDARASEISGDSARSASRLDALGTVIGGASKVSSSLMTDYTDPAGSRVWARRSSAAGSNRGRIRSNV